MSVICVNVWPLIIQKFASDQQNKAFFSCIPTIRENETAFLIGYGLNKKKNRINRMTAEVY